MKVLILGSSGLVGRELCSLLKENEIEYLGTYNTKKVDNSIYVDFTNDHEIEELFELYKPDVCVLSIVQRFTDICEKNWNETRFVNIDLVGKVSKICNKSNTYLIHISTDYVFDGKKPPFYTDSTPNPLQNYGISKLISEFKVKANTKNYSIVRVPVLYSNNVLNFEESAVTVIAKKVLNRTNNTTEDNFSIRRPVFIKDFCYFLLDIINNFKEFQGIYHFYNKKDKTTKYKMAQMIGNYLHKSTDHITPINEEPNDGADRPFDTQLSDTTYNINNYHITKIDEGIPLCFKKIYHPKLYDNPNLNTKDIFILLDLDGTIVNTDNLHLESYNRAFKELGINLNINQELINDTNMDKFLNLNISDKKLITKVKELKKKYILNSNDSINLITGADKLINFIYDNKINHCVVTNTSLQLVEKFKTHNSLLNKLTNWVTREDYEYPKPSPDCYQLAVEKYINNENYIIGFENTITGYKSLKNVTSIIYMLCDKYNIELMKKEDVYLIDNFYDL